jgi:hypothetical protein
MPMKIEISDLPWSARVGNHDAETKDFTLDPEEM